MSAAANLKNFKKSTRRHSRRSVPMSEINVTPFVDVMLVLLIIFMVAAPMLTVGVDVELPKSAANALQSENEEPLTITITRKENCSANEYYTKRRIDCSSARCCG